MAFYRGIFAVKVKEAWGCKNMTPYNLCNMFQVFQCHIIVTTPQGARRRGVQTNLPLMKHKHMETWSTRVRQTIPDIRHGENQGLRILGNKRGELKQVRRNQTQLGGMIIKEHTGNGEQEKTYMDIGGRETQDMGTQV